ncbi:MAG: hypothetical protein JSW08_03675 [archaeon]|nr:MAG: hypothetical protein JSW08_03675 [archaeon]
MAKLSWKIWLLIVFIIIFALVIINPLSFTSGLQIKEVNPNSAAALAGMKTGEVLQQINGIELETLTDYFNFVGSITLDPVDITVKTDEGTFKYESKTLDFVVENQTITDVYGNAQEVGLELDMEVTTINSYSLEDNSFIEIKLEVEPSLRVEIKTNKQEYIFLTSEDLGLTLKEISGTRIATGLDLQGGARAIVKPVEPISEQEFEKLLSTVRYRLNVYGITDVNVRKAKDISGESYLVVELAGATPKELKDLVSKQGKFEAKIANQTVFVGGNNDITFVCRDDASCAYIKECFDTEQGAACTFNFGVHLSSEAAKRHAEMTKDLEENITEGSSYLNESLELYLDDVLVSTLRISSDLKGKETTEVAISGSGVGKTKQEAYDAAEADMKELQTVLITGSLPVKLEVDKLDFISPALGKEFLRNIIIAALAVFLAVLVIIYIRYRKIKFFIPVIITLVSELFLILGIAALIRWNIDLPSIAGIIAAIGTGVDDQIVMLDESKSRQYSIKERIKRAFFIILAAYATTFVAMIPLMWAGAGLLRGFAVTTLIGITIGVLITRPAFGEILKLVVKK